MSGTGRQSGRSAGTCTNLIRTHRAAGRDIRRVATPVRREQLHVSARCRTTSTVRYGRRAPRPCRSHPTPRPAAWRCRRWSHDQPIQPAPTTPRRDISRRGVGPGCALARSTTGNITCSTVCWSTKTLDERLPPVSAIVPKVSTPPGRRGSRSRESEVRGGARSPRRTHASCLPSGGAFYHRSRCGCIASGPRTTCQLRERLVVPGRNSRPLSSNAWTSSGPAPHGRHHRVARILRRAGRPRVVEPKPGSYRHEAAREVAAERAGQPPPRYRDHCANLELDRELLSPGLERGSSSNDLQTSANSRPRARPLRLHRRWPLAPRVELSSGRWWRGPAALGGCSRAGRRFFLMPLRQAREGRGQHDGE